MSFEKVSENISFNVEYSLIVKVFSIEKKLICGQKNTDRRS